DKIRTRSACSLAHDLADHAFEKRLCAAFEHIGGSLQARGSSVSNVGSSFRVAQHQRLNSSTELSPEFEQDVTTDGDSDEGRPGDLFFIEEASQVCGMFGHRGRAFAHSRVAVPTKVGKDQSIARLQGLSRRMPKFVMGR